MPVTVDGYGNGQKPVTREGDAMKAITAFEWVAVLLKIAEAGIRLANAIIKS